MDEGTAVWFFSAAFEPMQVCATAQADPSKENLVKEIMVSM